GSDNYGLDLSAPSAPTVVIATDANNDGYINKAEQGSATTDTVNIGLPADAKAGDTLNVTINGVAQAGHVLTAAEITAGQVVITPTAPAEGGTLTVAATITDPAGNTSAQGSDSAKLDTTAPSAPTVVIATDANNDGYINKAEQGSATTDTVNIGLPADAKAGDTLNVTINGVAQTGHVLTAAEITAGQVVLTPTAPAEGGTLTVAATITDPAGNTSAQGSDSAKLDTTAPSAPTVVITTDANNDGYINKAEQGSATTDTVNIGLPADAKAGDTLNVTINGVAQTGHVLTAAEITAGQVVITPTAPAEGGTLTVAATITDPAGNTSAQGSDSAKLDTTAPSAPTVVIATDANNDGFINKAEQGSATTDTVNIGLPADAKAGDTLNVTINGVAQTGHVLTAAEITAGQVVLTPAAPAEGGTLTVAATITDPAGNTSVQGSDSAKLDTTAPSAPTVVIATDANNDGFINKAEQGSATTDTVNIGLPADAKAGDTLNVTINGVAQAGHVLTAAEITAGQVVITPTAPAEGGTLTVAATITDVAGNTSAQGSDSATLITSGPLASITVDPVTADNVLNIAETSGATVTVTGTVGGDVKVGDTVTLTVNGHNTTGQVIDLGNGQLGYNIAVSSTDLKADSTVHASVTTTDSHGNSSTAT
uniref:Ig-like domain-containing protein n=2 Tax=Aquitalea palustris TaxID=2480983 RepID=UPI001CF021C0